MLTGGTDVHLVLVDLGPTGLDGKTAEKRLEQVGITVNRNAIPFDERPPMNPSGLRIGTPALTTRGLVEDDMREIAAGDRRRALGRVRVRARGAGRADPRADGALSALSPAFADLGLSYCTTPAQMPAFVNVAAPPPWLLYRSANVYLPGLTGEKTRNPPRTGLATPPTSPWPGTVKRV